MDEDTYIFALLAELMLADNMAYIMQKPTHNLDAVQWITKHWLVIP